MGFTLRQKVSMLPKEISLQAEIINENIRGIYGIFSLTDSTKKCIYIGRAANIASRMLSNEGHLSDFYSYSLSELKNMALPAMVPQLILDEILAGKKICIEIIEKVPYVGDEYHKDMQRLAFAESKAITEYQDKGECLYQLPEGSWISKDTWNELYRKRL